MQFEKPRNMLWIAFLLLALLAPGARAWRRPGPNYGAYGHIGYRGQTRNQTGRRFHAPYGYHPNWTSPGYLYSRPWYTPPVDPYVPLSNDERYQGAKRKGDRAAGRGNWQKAVAQYQDARQRATRFWGEGSRQAQEAAELERQARFKQRMRGQSGSRGDYQRLLARGQRALRRGLLAQARQHLSGALRAASTSLQAEQAADLLNRTRSGNTTLRAQR